MPFLGWKLIKVSELALKDQLEATKIALLAADLRRAEEYTRKCEALIDKERARADSERARADRQLDNYLQSQGQPAVTDSVLAAQEEFAHNAQEKQTNYLRQMAEIGADTLNNLYDEDGCELPPELAAAAEEMLRKAAN